MLISVYPSNFIHVLVECAHCCWLLAVWCYAWMYLCACPLDIHSTWYSMRLWDDSLCLSVILENYWPYVFEMVLPFLFCSLSTDSHHIYGILYIKCSVLGVSHFSWVISVGLPLAWLTLSLGLPRSPSRTFFFIIVFLISRHFQWIFSYSFSLCDEISHMILHIISFFPLEQHLSTWAPWIFWTGHFFVKKVMIWVS